MTTMEPVRLLRLFVSVWDSDHKLRKKRLKTVNATRKLRKRDPQDWIRTLKKPKAKS